MSSSLFMAVIGLFGQFTVVYAMIDRSVEFRAPISFYVNYIYNVIY